MNYVGILLVVSVITGMILLFTLKGVHLDNYTPPKLVKVVTIESMSSVGDVGDMNNVGNVSLDSIDDMTNPGESFCKEYVGDSVHLEEACSKLTEKNCKNSSCCGWLNGNKCVAGGSAGPTYKTDDSKERLPESSASAPDSGSVTTLSAPLHPLISIDSYYYMNTCSGKGCLLGAEGE